MSCRKSSEYLDFCKETFNKMTLFVHMLVNLSLL